MKLHTANGSSLEVKPEGLVAVLTMWTKGKETRSIKLNPTELRELAWQLVAVVATIENRRTAKDKVY